MHFLIVGIFKIKKICGGNSFILNLKNVKTIEGMMLHEKIARVTLSL